MLRSLLVGLASAALLLVCVFVLHIPLGWSLLAGLMAYLGLHLTIGRSPHGMDALPEVRGMTNEEVYRIIKEGQGKVASIRELCRGVRDTDLRHRVGAIADVAADVFEELERDPKDILQARRFLEYYIDATLLVVQRYVDLSKRAGGSVEVQGALHGFESLLESIHATFIKQRDRLLRDDALDLETEIDVLKRMMEMEGL